MTDAPLSLIDRVIEKLEGPTEAARKLNLKTASVVLNWRKRGKIPADKVLAIETATGISRHEMRPDVFGDAA